MSDYAKRRATVERLTERIIQHNREQRRTISEHEARKLAQRAEKINRRS